MYDDAARSGRESPSKSAAATSLTAPASGIDWSRVKLPAGVAVEDLDGAGVRGHGEVGPAVAVEVGGGEADRRGADRERRLRGEAVVGRPAQEGGDGAGGVVGDREIGAAVAVEVGGDDADGIVADRDRRLGGERATGNPQQDRRAVAAPVGDRQVGQPVAVVVADGDRDRREPGRQRRLRGEAGVLPVAEQEHDLVAVVQRHREVEPSVAVEVARGDRADARAERDRRACLMREAAAGLAQEHRHVARGEGRHREVRAPVAVVVADRRAARPDADRDRRTRLLREAAAGLAQEHRHIVARPVDGRHVGAPVAVEVGGVERVRIVSHRVRRALDHERRPGARGSPQQQDRGKRGCGHPRVHRPDHPGPDATCQPPNGAGVASPPPGSSPPLAAGNTWLMTGRRARRPGSWCVRLDSYPRR